MDQAKVEALAAAWFRDGRPRSMEATSRATGTMPRGVPMSWMDELYDHPPLWVSHGAGSRFWDLDGHEYVDMYVADMSAFCGHAAGWSRRQEPADLGVSDHREPWVGIASLEGADDQACCLKPRAHDQIIGVGNPAAYLLFQSTGSILLAGTAARSAAIPVLITGMLLLDNAIQSGQVANQGRIFALAPHYRSRLNTAYMTCAFLSGSAGSWLGVRAYQWLGWPGVCALAATLAALPLLAMLSPRPRSFRHSQDPDIKPVTRDGMPETSPGSS